MICLHSLRSCLVLLSLLLAHGCGGGEPLGAGAPPPRTVFVAPPRRAAIVDVQEYPARLEAVDRVEIRARVAGRLEQQLFRPRALVQAGELLFKIEPDRYAATVEGARADILRGEARETEADATLGRLEKALEQNATSELEVLRQRATRDAAQADVHAAEAALTAAQLDLTYAEVRSPITGRISREFVDVGNLVGVAEPTLLAYVVRTDQVHAYFQVDEQAALAFRRVNRDRITAEEGTLPMPVELRLMDETDFEHKGVVDYAAPDLDRATGTIEVRALFENPSELLAPGFYGRVRIETQASREGLLVPVRAIGNDVGGAYVLVVGQDDVVSVRQVELGIVQGTEREVAQGLDGSERVIVEGIGVVRPGDQVTPKVKQAADAKPADNKQESEG